MHAQYPARETLRQQIERIQRELDALFANLNCRFGRCRQPATVMTLTRTPMGARLELLCCRHARRRGEDAELADEEAIDLPELPTLRLISPASPTTPRVARDVRSRTSRAPHGNAPQMLPPDVGLASSPARHPRLRSLGGSRAQLA